MTVDSPLGKRVGERETGVAPIKKEYLLNVDRNTIPRVQDDDAAEQDKGRYREQGRGNHQNRTKVNRSGPSQNAVTGYCPLLARGEVCARGDECRFHHDQEEFLKNRLPDLGEVCPNVVASGTCRFGTLCRYASGHPDDMPIASVSVEESIRLLGKFRKKELEFTETASYFKRVKEEGENFSLLEAGERKQIDFREKLYLAPLTTVGNLPFRRICKEYGVDITCGEMAMCTNILKGQTTEWALLRRHESEDIFGIQVCGGWTDSMTQCAELFNTHIDCDFVDVNMGCPIDVVFRKGMGSGLMDKTNRVKQILTGMRSVLKDKPLTVKMRIGIDDGKPLVGKLLPALIASKIDALTIHGRTRQQRYTKEADWSYISQVVDLAKPHNLPLIGNGDILSYEDYRLRKEVTGVDSVMIARGALIKPWIFTEIKEERHWDIRSSERLELLKKYVRYGLEHFGSDTAGVERTRRFLLEWMSFLCRYVPVGILEYLPPKINDRPPAYFARDDLETLMASPSVKDWVKLSEMVLGPTPEDFIFLPKHKSNSYETAVLQG